jgi:flagellar hook-associated protein 1
MGLLTSLSTAMSGLRTTQASIDLVATNVANANSVGYNRRVMSPIQQVATWELFCLSNSAATGAQTM